MQHEAAQRGDASDEGTQRVIPAPWVRRSQPVFSLTQVLFGAKVAGGIASIGWNPGVWSVGASGAIFGLAGALIASFYLGEFSLPRFAIKGTLRSLLFFAGFNLLFGSMFPGIDKICHIG